VDATPPDDMPSYSAIMFAEVAEHHDAYADRRDRYRTSIREFVEVADGFRSAEAYIAAVRAREGSTAAWESWFAEHRVDVLLEPTCPSTAPARGHGYDSGNLGGETDPLIMLTHTWNHVGFPAVALPAGMGARTGLPVGVSLVAPRGREAPLLQIAIDLQEHALGTLPPEGGPSRPGPSG
ncbi:MAG TPA: amidase family protein, partial [Solirubrobacteraceae bacterium]|nr:amidase family protein [Solirubrobacteraceae bacterium]